tara:strand:+ start:1553 stop:1801 length:249 start_codon:yes stop_codon:yes gene_type:complete
MIVEVTNRTWFRVKCVDVKNTTTLTLDKLYTVVQIGFNGSYCLKGDTGRKVWHLPKRFKVIRPPINTRDLVVIGSTPENFLK